MRELATLSERTHRLPADPQSRYLRFGVAALWATSVFLAVANAQADGPVVAWGHLDYVATNSLTPPASVNGTVGVASAIEMGGGSAACAIQSGSGAVVCWGVFFGSSHVAPTPPASVDGTAGSASAISVGDSDACAIQASSGAVVCWGLGVIPTPPASVNGTAGSASAISVGWEAACAIQAGSGAVVCWAEYGYPPDPPAAVNGTAGTASAIAVDAGHACAIQAGSGAVVCWYVGYGPGDSPPPASVNGTAGSATAIAVGYEHACAIQAGSGAVVCWGSNFSGQSTPPASVNGTAGSASAIAARFDATCAIQAGTGAVVCWGGNYYGQVAPPASVNGTAGMASAIAGGNLTFLALREGGPSSSCSPANDIALYLRPSPANLVGDQAAIQVAVRESGHYLTSGIVSGYVSEGPNRGTALACRPSASGLFPSSCDLGGLEPGVATLYYTGSQAGLDEVTVFAPGNAGCRRVDVEWTEPIKYVALGDSFSAGEGLPSYLPGSDTETNQCHRSDRAYPSVLSLFDHSREQPQGGSWDFLACSGAETKHVLPGGDAQHDEPGPQLDQAPVDADVDLVTITIGGNDMLFSDVITYCFLGPCGGDTEPHWDGRTLSEVLDDMIVDRYPRLVDTFTAIKTTMPNAAVFVLGYPQLFPWSQAEQSCAKLSPPLPWGMGWAGEQDLLRAKLSAFNDAIAQAAAEVGVHFVSVEDDLDLREDAFGGHEICGTNGEWINGPTLQYGDENSLEGVPGDASFHPNADGQAGYAIALQDFIERKIKAGSPLNPLGLPENPLPAPITPGALTASAAAMPLGAFGSLSILPTAPPACGGPQAFIPAQEARVTGDGFAPGSAVALNFLTGEGSGIALPSANASAAGDLDVTLLIPSVPTPGRLGIEANGTGPGGEPRKLLEAFAVLAAAPPCLADDTIVSTVGVAITVDVLANDGPGGAPLDPSSMAITQRPQFGTASVDAATHRIIYTPTSQSTSGDSFEYLVCDTLRGCAVATVLATVEHGCTITGTSGDDVLDGTAGDDVICGLDGDDILLGHGGDDILVGERGNDRLDGGSGNDTIYGDDGDDLLAGREGNDFLEGGRGADSLLGGDGDDLVHAGDGSDVARGGSGKDDVRGGGGDDYLEGDAGDDDLRGDGGDDELHGGPDADQLRGGPGPDFLFGENGDDWVDGGPEADVLDGGVGTNVLRDDICGNHVQEYAEGCDDGNLASGDGCDALCQPEGVACSDGVDSDGDDLVDYPADPGCVDAADTTERGRTACDDGRDGDEDGLIDFPADPGCASAASTLENPQCNDGLDNDGDGKVDWDGGPAAGPPDSHCAGYPFRNREQAPAGCGLGAELTLLALAWRLRVRADRRRG